MVNFKANATQLIYIEYAPRFDARMTSWEFRQAILQQSYAISTYFMTEAVDWWWVIEMDPLSLRYQSPLILVLFAPFWLALGGGT